MFCPIGYALLYIWISMPKAITLHTRSSRCWRRKKTRSIFFQKLIQLLGSISNIACKHDWHANTEAGRIHVHFLAFVLLFCTVGESFEKSSNYGKWLLQLFLNFKSQFFQISMTCWILIFLSIFFAHNCVEYPLLLLLSFSLSYSWIWQWIWQMTTTIRQWNFWKNIFSP